MERKNSQWEETFAEISSEVAEFCYSGWNEGTEGEKGYDSKTLYLLFYSIEDV